MGAPTSTEQLRRHNTSVVLRSLRADGPATRAELAKRTGLAKATVGVIVAGLVEVRAVTELDTVAALGPGRPGVQVGLDGRGYAGLGLEINVDYVSAVAVDLAGEVVWQQAVGADPDPLSALTSLAADAAARAGSRELVATTVAIPGLVRDDDRTVSWAPNLGLDGTTVAAAVEQVVAPPVMVSNDANCAALAEAHHGAARGVTHGLFLTGTVGIGAGIIQDGHLVRGAHGFAGEVGHLQIGAPEALCGCGRRGCWEASIGLHALTKRLGMTELDTPTATAQAVAGRIGTEHVDRVLTDLGRHLGRGLAVLSSILDPEVIVLGGYFAGLGEAVLGPARSEIDARLASPSQVRPRLRLSELGPVSAALGAAETSLSAVFSGERELGSGVAHN